MSVPLSLAEQPAFPISEDMRKGWDAEHGLTKREYFAAMALSGLCNESHGEAYTVEGAAVRAVKMADALIAELSK